MSDLRNAAVKQVTRDKQEAILLKKGALKFTDCPVIEPILSTVKDGEENKALLERNLPLDTEDNV